MVSVDARLKRKAVFRAAFQQIEEKKRKRRKRERKRRKKGREKKETKRKRKIYQASTAARLCKDNSRTPKAMPAAGFAILKENYTMHQITKKNSCLVGLLGYCTPWGG